MMSGSQIKRSSIRANTSSYKLVTVIQAFTSEDFYSSSQIETTVFLESLRTMVQAGNDRDWTNPERDSMRNNDANKSSALSRVSHLCAV